MGSRKSLDVADAPNQGAACAGQQDDLNFLERCCTGTEYPIVLVATGSFCPPHRGHLEMMLAAKEALGPDVVPVGAILVPSSDSYVMHKGVPFISFELRSQLLQAIASDMGIGSWIHISDAEHKRDEFYLQVLTNMSLAAAERGPSSPTPQLVFVTGSDRPMPLRQTRKGMAGVVVVPRAGDHPPTLPSDRRDDPLRCVAAPLAGSAAALSSTQLRDLVQGALAVAKRDGALPRDAIEAAVRESMSPAAAILYASAVLSSISEFHESASESDSPDFASSFVGTRSPALQNRQRLDHAEPV